MSDPSRQMSSYRLPQLPGQQLYHGNITWLPAGHRQQHNQAASARLVLLQPATQQQQQQRLQAARQRALVAVGKAWTQERVGAPALQHEQRARAERGPAQRLRPAPAAAATTLVAATGRSGVSGTDSLGQNGIFGYLEERPEVVDAYVAKHVSIERLHRWLRAKRRVDGDGSGTSSAASAAGASPLLPPQVPGDEVAVAKSRSTPRAAVDEVMKKTKEKRQNIQQLVRNIHERSCQVDLLLELVNSVSTALAADGHSLFLFNSESHTITQVPTPSTSSQPTARAMSVRSGIAIAEQVAQTKRSLRVSRSNDDSSRPLSVILSEDGLQSVLAQPILDAADTVMGIAEFYRLSGNRPFTIYDEQVAASASSWAAALLAEAKELQSDATKQRKMNEFLLQVAKNIFEDIVSMDTVIMKIMDFAKRLVKADRASLFLLDTQSKEVYAQIFDVGSAAAGGEGHGTREIRFPMDKGVAGFVASTGQTLNIEDAYSDVRFNREVDLRTGYTTKTILCMPIRIRGAVMGVVQMVNKHRGVFTKSDEEAFETFAVYCGLALHHAKLYEVIAKSEQKHKVALEVLAYHNRCSDEEYGRLSATKLPDRIQDLYRLDFSPWSVAAEDKSLYVIYMFKDLMVENRFGTMFNMARLARFTLTVRKNYRKVPYHNWDHAFSVAHAMYALLKTGEHKFGALEALGLFVACLCHDLDHRGKTNSFMIKSDSPLAAIYTTSVMEHHHFNQTVSILQQDGHEIFKDFSSEDYKTVLGHIKGCILATDLALFFGNKAKLTDCIESGQFSWENGDHRQMLMFHAMTAADLCAMYKPWQTCWQLAHVIMEEFWQQGDEEKAKGLTPIAMMDRDKADQLPQSQVGFIVGICLPCYELLVRLIPAAQVMVDGARNNLEQWQRLAERYEKSKASTTKSLKSPEA